MPTAAHIVLDADLAHVSASRNREDPGFEPSGSARCRFFPAIFGLFAMTDAPSSRLAFAIEVSGGADHGVRLRVDTIVRTVGRARGADLVLGDPTISRRHLQVIAIEGGVAFAVCGDAAPFAFGGQPLRALDAKEGDRIVLGNTTLAVVRVATTGTADAGGNASFRTDVGTLLTGAAEDTRAIAAVHALIEVLNAARDRGALDDALRHWAEGNARAQEVEINGAPAAPADGAKGEVLTRPGGGDLVAITVPASSDEALRITFKCAIAEAHVTDSFRRMLVVAASVFGAAAARVRQIEVAAGEVASLREISFGSARGFLGTSSASERVANLIPRIAASDVGVLIDGETGVGKTFIARLIHEAGPRAGEPLRIVNCAAIPESLAEAELFGHERGAFTGAVAARPGAFEYAGRGTLLLDEIGELSLPIQAKLLRVLEDRTFERVGSNRPIEMRARVLAATNRNLERMIAAKQFRGDLFFRISVVRLAVPPLRERGDDLLLLARQLLADASRTAGRRITAFSPDAIEVLRRYAWPGNVRELRNAVEHAVALGDGEIVTPADLPMGMGGSATQPDDVDLVRLPLDLATLERRAIDAALRHTNGNRTKAAALLGVNRQTLYNRLAESEKG